jgi:hypothetical protein
LESYKIIKYLPMSIILSFGNRKKVTWG